MYLYLYSGQTVGRSGVSHASISDCLNEKIQDFGVATMRMGK
jgi:hypothetical protein